VSGRNAQGKTSLFDAIRLCVGGAKLTDGKPVRDGEDKAVVELDLGDLIVKRSLTAKGGNTVTVNAKDGTAIKQPQDVLNKLYNKIAFNLLEFVEMKGKERYGLLKDVLGVGDQIEEMEDKHKALYDERTVANRLVKETEAKMSGVKVDDLVGYEKSSIAEIVAELEKAQKYNSHTDQLKREIEGHEQDIINREKAIANNLQKIKSLNEENKTLEKLITDSDSAIANKKPLIVEPIDTEPIKQKMNRLEDTNAIVDQNIKHRDLAAELTKQEEASKFIETKMDAITKKIKNTMEAIKMPIKGLSMAGGDVLYNGVPVDQASASEKLRVSMAIAMALKPEMKVILITDASLLDSDSMAEVEKIAEENGFQVWMELVDDTGQVGIVIEDGSVVATKEEG